MRITISGVMPSKNPAQRLSDISGHRATKGTVYSPESRNPVCDKNVGVRDTEDRRS
jgi:hypothetical protein